MTDTAAMGSFSYTCAVSGLPIEGGDVVRFYLVAANLHSERPCYAIDLWYPRVFPLRAVYNDYGSVDDVEPGAARQSWLDGFQADLVERGWGDNSFHDTAVSRDMGFESLLEALCEERVMITDGVPGGPVSPPYRNAAPIGVPTIQRVAEVAARCGLHVFSGTHNSKAVMIDDDDGFGRVRVRRGDFGSDDGTLSALESALRKEGYACMITRGTGTYSRDAELLVRPGPDARDYHFSPHPVKSDRIVPVRQAMIREDVWRALVTITVEDWNGCVETAEERVLGAREAWDAATAPEFQSWRGAMFRPFLEDAVPCTIGLGTSFRAVAARRSEMSGAEIEEFLTAAGEFAHIGEVLSRTRYMWRPSYANGPQFGEWQTHERVLDALTGIARGAATRREDDE